MNVSSDERSRAFTGMVKVFSRAVKESGILNDWRLKQEHETAGQKKRRKRRAAEVARRNELKNKLREHFGD
jgi:ribosomal protein S21